MHYLMIDQDRTCKWCMQALLQIFDEKDTKLPDEPIVLLCRICDRWPKELMPYGYV